MIFILLFGLVMSGDRPFDYEMDIFALLVDLVERPSGPSCDICLLTYISVGVLGLLFVIMCLVIVLLRRTRVQYTVGYINNKK